MLCKYSTFSFFSFSLATNEFSIAFFCFVVINISSFCNTFFLLEDLEIVDLQEFDMGWQVIKY